MLTVIEEELAAGARVRGYRLERELGKGGMGVVWEAVEESSRARVALKFLRPSAAGSKSALERFAREARSSMAIAHPNVARVVEVLETDWGLPFLVMDLLEGQSLRERLVARPRLALDEARPILLAIVDGLAAAHARGIVHRDVKPENVFLTSDGTVKVLDFGIAKKMASADLETLSATEGGFLGTPYYMAPEQVFGDGDVDSRVDVWALGVVVYECFAGRRPTDGSGFGQVLRRITTDTLEPLERAAPNVPRELCSLVGRMLSRDRSARPGLDEVRAVVSRVDDDDEPVPSSVTVDPERKPEATTAPAPSSRRSRVAGRSWLTIVAVVAVTAVAFGGVLASFFVRREPSAEDRLRAQDAVQGLTVLVAGRDGRECLRRLDEHDALDPTPASSSRDATTGLGQMRSTCLMLAGRCGEGRAMLERWLVASDAGALALPHADGMVAAYCEGDDLTPRDRVLVNAYRLTRAEAIARTERRAAARADECRSWYDAVVSGLAALPERGGPSLEGARSTVPASAAICIAMAGDCAGAGPFAARAYGMSEADWRAAGSSMAPFRSMLDFTPCATSP